MSGFLASVNNSCKKEAVQLLSKAYLRVQEWKQMEMETVVGWLSLKEGSEKRGGIKGSKLKVEISIGACLQDHGHCGANTHTRTNTFLTVPPLVCTVQLSMKRVSSQVQKKKNLSKCIIIGAITHKRESAIPDTTLLQKWHFTISLHIYLPPHICH